MAAAPVVTSAPTARATVPRAPLAAGPVAGNPTGTVLNARHRFDLRAEPVDLFGRQIRLKQSRVHQQVAFDPVTGLVYVTQIISDGRRLADEPAAVPGAERDRRGDLCVNEVTPDGTVRAVMYLRGVGHGGGLGVEHVDGRPWLWLETDATPDTSRFGYGKRIGRVAFTPDAVIDAGSGSIEVFDPVPTSSRTTPALDAEHGRIGVRHGPLDAEEYRIYDLGAFKRRDFTPLYTFPCHYRTQTWCLYGDLVYQNEGSAYGSAAGSGSTPDTSSAETGPSATGRRFRRLRRPYSFRTASRGHPAAMDTTTSPEETIETQGDEHRVVLAADTNGDGRPDVWMTDTTGDGKADLYQFDTTGDGRIDVTIAERAEEPGADRLVVEGDGGHPQQV